MLYHERHQGIYVTPEFYSELYGAYHNQSSYLRENPRDTETEVAQSVHLYDELRLQVNAPYRDAFSMNQYIDGQIAEVERMPDQNSQDSSVAIQPHDVEHLVESLHRQAAALIISAVHYRGTIEGLAAQSMADHKIGLAYGLHSTCSSSIGGRKGVPAHFALGHKPQTVR